MLKNHSVATISAPEFINVEPYNPLISQCEIKVLYLGENRNHSYITKNVAIQMANSLPGTPIVAAFIEEKEDFGDHGQVITIEDGEIKFSCKTQPYGFVAPDAQIWFQKFIDTDEFGNEVEREYLMTTGYLWSGQYPEIQKAIDEGQPHSMEIDEESMEGHWATNNSGVEFFIINDATFSKLCILGDDVEPCFEGSSVTAPEVSKNFQKDPAFATTLFTMMEELKNIIYNEGGSDMPETEIVQEIEQDNTLFAADADETSEEIVETEFAEKKEELAEEVEEEVEDSEDEEEEKKPEDEEFKKRQGCHSLEESDEHSLDEVESKFAEMEAELESLRAFKLGIENQQKDALIAKYFMLSDADKAEVIEHKEQYSLDEIEAKLAVAYVKANVNFDSLGEEEEEVEAEESPISTFSLDDNEGAEFVSSLQARLRQTR